MQNGMDVTRDFVVLSRWRRLDERLFLWMGAGHHARPGLLLVAVTMARWSWLPMLMALIAAAAHAGSGPWIVTGCLLTAGMVQILSKQSACRWGMPRPFQRGLSPNHLRHGGRAGFPSTHAMVMGAVCGFMMVAVPASPFLVLIGVLALATAWARVYTGAHFPLDVLAGLCLGCGAGLLSGWLLAPWFRSRGSATRLHDWMASIGVF